MRFELGSPDSGAGEKSQEGSEYFTAGSRAISTAGTVSAANRFLPPRGRTERLRPLRAGAFFDGRRGGLVAAKTPRYQARNRVGDEPARRPATVPSRARTAYRVLKG